MRPDHDEHVLELRFQVGNEGERPGLLEYDGDDVVSDVSLARELLAVVGRVGEEGGDVEHELVAGVGGVHGVEAGGVVCNKKENMKHV